MLKGYQQMTAEFDVALKKDLGQSSFVANAGSHGVAIADIEDVLANLDSWVKPESRPTPLSNDVMK